MQSEKTDCLNRGNELQSERTDCLLHGNELPFHGNELLIRENGLHNSILRFTYGVFLLKISMSHQGFRTSIAVPRYPHGFYFKICLLFYGAVVTGHQKAVYML